MKRFPSVLKGFILGVVLSVLVVSMCVPAFASNGSKSITVFFKDIKMYIDNNLVTPTDAKGNVVEPFVYNGTTYLPVRAIGNALGKEVSWDGSTNTVYIGDNTAKSIEDDFTKPLSNNWDLTNNYSEWTADSELGVTGKNTAYLSLKKELVSNTFTIECSMDINNQSMGVFIYGGDSINYGTKKLYRVGISDWAGLDGSASVVIYDSQQFGNNATHSVSIGKIDNDIYHKLKLVVKNETVDIYVDDNYVTSDTIPEYSLTGKRAGIYHNAGHANYMNHFKLSYDE